MYRLLHKNDNAEKILPLSPAYKILENPQVLIFCPLGNVHLPELEQVKGATSLTTLYCR